MKASVCIATYDKASYLDKTLASIVRQQPPFEWECIVVDDGSPTDATRKVCETHPVIYLRRERPPGYSNPAAARNMAYRTARGDVLICQSDDVIHGSVTVIQDLVQALVPDTFVVATVINVDGNGKPYSANTPGFGDKLSVYASPQKQRPLLFLGALWRRHLYAIGGNDEEFTAPSGEDRWFGLCLTRGLGLRPIYSTITGYHQHHEHCSYTAAKPSQRLVRCKIQAAIDGRIPWCASGGPWPLASAEAG